MPVAVVVCARFFTGVMVSNTLVSAASLPATRCTDTVCMGIGIKCSRALGQLLLSLAWSVDMAALLPG